MKSDIKSILDLAQKVIEVAQIVLSEDKPKKKVLTKASRRSRGSRDR
jgi:hypothetical protein